MGAVKRLHRLEISYIFILNTDIFSTRFNINCDLSGLKPMRAKGTVVAHSAATAARDTNTDAGDGNDDDDDDDGDDGNDDMGHDDGSPEALAAAGALAWKRAATTVAGGAQALDTFQTYVSACYPNLIWSPKHSRTTSRKTLRDDQMINS